MPQGAGWHLPVRHGAALLESAQITWIRLEQRLVRDWCVVFGN